MKHAALSTLAFALVVAGAQASPSGDLDCEELEHHGPPALSLKGRESVQFQLIVTRAVAESEAPLDGAQLAAAFADRLMELTRCPAARALLPSLSESVARVRDGHLMLTLEGKQRPIDVQNEAAGRFAAEAVRRLTAARPSEAASRLAWAAWVEALLAARGGTGEDYVYAERARAAEVVPSSLAWTRDCCLGYLRIRRFTESTGRELEAALSALRREGIEDLVIDLRGNAGGRVSLEPIELLLPKGDVLALRSEIGADRKQTLRALRAGLPFRLVLLVDAGTASMAELFAAALQGSGRATLVGERTHGKGVGQRSHPVGGEGLLILDAFEYFHPGTGERWSAAGLRPDRVLSPGPPPEEPAALNLDAIPEADHGLRLALELLASTSRSEGSTRP